MRLRFTLASPLAPLLAILLATAARADDAAVAREKLARFLTEGALAPCRLAEVADLGLEAPLAAGELTFVRPGELVASVGSGEVTFFSRSKPLLFVEGTRRERAAEIARRARYSLEENAVRARRFLEDHYPAFAERKFELVSQERRDHDSLVADELTFVERPRAGIAACWPNRIELALDPEDGSVTTYVATHDRIESATPPALDAQGARDALVRAIGERVKPANREFLRSARAELIAARDKDGKPRTAWLVARIFVVDASSGELLSRRER